MLPIDLRALTQGPIAISQSVPPDAALFSGVDFVLKTPVSATGRLTDAGPGRVYWRGTMKTTAQGSCRRCLRDLDVPVRADVDVLFTEDPMADDPSVYRIPARSTELDLSEAVREELILAVPAYVLCREDCRGICPRCGADLNAGPCDCRPAPDPRWDALKATRSDDER